MTSGLILTNSGAAEIEAAYQSGQVVKIKEVALGDGNGVDVEPDPAVTALVNQFGVEQFSYGQSGENLIEGQVIIPADKYPQKTLREVGLISESGTLIAYGAYPATWLPDQTDSIIKEIEMMFSMPLVHAECVELIVDPNIAVITIEEGDKRYYQQSLRLKELEDAGADAQAEARGHMGLKSGSIHDVQENRDDTTPGRVLVSGGALALRSVAAKAGTDIADASALPANSVSFCYSDAAYSPGYEATILDVGGLGGDGYRVQYAASYADGGKQLKFRTLNADNGQWGAWTNVLTNYGGSVDHIDGATSYSTNTNTWAGCGGFADQYTNGIAPFLHQAYTTPKDGSIYLPLIKGITQTEYYGFGAAVSFGILRSGSNDFGSAVIHIIGDSGKSAMLSFNTDGLFAVPGQLYSGGTIVSEGNITANGGNIHAAGQLDCGGNIVAGQGVYESGGAVRVYSSNNPPPLPVTDVALGAEGSFIVQKDGWQRVPAGCTQTGYNFEGDNPGGDTIFYRPIQKYVPNVGWVTVGHAA